MLRPYSHQWENKTRTPVAWVLMCGFCYFSRNLTTALDWWFLPRVPSAFLNQSGRSSTASTNTTTHTKARLPQQRIARTREVTILNAILLSPLSPFRNNFITQHSWVSDASYRDTGHLLSSQEINACCSWGFPGQAKVLIGYSWDLRAVSRGTSVP